MVGVCVEDLLETSTSAAGVDYFFTSLGSLATPQDMGLVSNVFSIPVPLAKDGSHVMDKEEAIKYLLGVHGM